MSDDRLRALFDVLDVEATEERLSAALDAETTDPGRAEVLTQLARVAFWRDRPDEAERLLEEADSLAGETGVARARVLLERGRIVRRTGGDTVALSLLEEAYEVALAARQHFIAADAAHSCALAGDMIAWTNSSQSSKTWAEPGASLKGHSRTLAHSTVLCRGGGRLPSS